MWTADATRAGAMRDDKIEGDVRYYPQVDGIARLQEFAKSCGGRARSCMHGDPNVPELLTVEYRYRSGLMSVWTRASPSYFSLDVMVQTGLEFSVGQPERILGATTRWNIWEASGSDIYVRPERDNRDVRAWLEDAEHRRLIVSLREDEAVQVFGNRITVTLRATRDLSAALIESFWNFAQTFARDAQEGDDTIDESMLPPPLGDLLRRFRHLAISDDVLRQDTLEDLDESERELFLQEVGAQFPAINSYLDSLDSLPDPWPDAALYLSRLAEAASELLVERHRARKP